MDLQEISDRLEITDVITRYTRAIDTGEWDRLDTVFTADAQIDYTESGGIRASFPEVKPWLAEMLPAFFPKRMHTIGQVEIDFDGPDAAAVVALPKPRGGEDVAAAIVVRNGVEIEPEAVRDFCKTRLAAYKVPRRIVVVDELPRSLIGKVLRRQVRERLMS